MTGIIRYFLFLLIGLAGMALLLFGLLFIDTALSVIQRIRELPDWLAISMGLLAFGLSLPFAWLGYWLLHKSPIAAKTAASTAPPSREHIEQQMAGAEALGADTYKVRQELENLLQRKAQGEIHAAVFGEISSGKSTLIRALLPDSEALSGVTGGTTREIREYSWTSPAGDRLLLVDMPGLQEAGGTLDRLASEEALRAHLVIYLCEGDLTRTQFNEIAALAELDKPIILAINKIDRFSAADISAITAKVKERLAVLGSQRLQVVGVSAGGRREVIRVDPNGAERRELMELPPQVGALREAIQRVVDSDPQALEQLRDSAVFLLAQRQLDEAIAEQRREKAAKLVDGYGKKAVAGAMAAITPGTDLIIQGWLASRMVKELCQLYEVPARQIDLDQLLQLIQSKTSRITAVIFAIAGNALKAFPGVGTLLGGALHAVAYGIIIDALGRSVAASLESRGELRPRQAAEQFKEFMGGNVEISARRMAKLAYNEIKRISR